MNSSDTIVAISSSVGIAPRMIVRIAGPRARALAVELFFSTTTHLAVAPKVHASNVASPQPPAGASLQRIWPGVLAWVYVFAAPHSYTGDDLVEFHIPGNPLLARMLLDEIVRRGARQAEAGEFTARAYFNGRMDLTQAEGVAATIAAHSQRELRAARQLLGGELARRLTPVMDNVAQTLALVEVGIDFSDEDVTFLSADQVREHCQAAQLTLEAILNDSARFERLGHEPTIVLIGRPNAGKSTLLNALSGSARAIVSNVAGTTRDAIWAEVRLPRGVVRIVDVAGIEEVRGPWAVGSVEEGIARQMHEQAMRAVETADVVVWVEDSSVPTERLQIGREIDLVVKAKIDLLRKDEMRKTEETDKNVCPTASVSAKSTDGIQQLRIQLDQLAFGNQTGAGLALNVRHVSALDEAGSALKRAADSIPAGAEVVAMELRESLDALGGVLGKMSPDDLLGRVFSRFCIGK